MWSLNSFHSPFQESSVLRNEKRKEELLAMMVQTMKELGYRNSAKQLAQECNMQFEDQPVQALSDKALEGNWEEALKQVEESELSSERKKKINFLIHEQKYIELIANQQYNDGLLLLRNELALNTGESDRLKTLASILLCSSPKEIEEKLGIKYDVKENRQNLLRRIYEELGPEHFSYANRFYKLIQQALSFQLAKCKYHKQLSDNWSLLEDHQCRVDDYPSKPCLGILEHNDQINIAKFSNKGDLFATVTKKGELYIWEFFLLKLAPLLKHRKRKIHDKEVNTLSWCPDDSRIATASADKKIKIWDIETGDLIGTLLNHQNSINSVLWIPGTPNFVSGGLDHYVIVWSGRGEEVTKIASPSITDMLATSDGKSLYLVCSSFLKIIIIDMEIQEQTNQIHEKNAITSAILSKDDQYLLTHVGGSSPELHLWDLQTLEIIRIFEIQTTGILKLGLSLGGSANQFIACGEENGAIKIWHKNDTRPLATLHNHSSVVNSMSWHPTNPHLLISASDDHSVCFWISEELQNKLNEKTEMNEEGNKDQMILEEYLV